MSNRGGKRENAGRPRGQGKYGEPTVTMRIPQSQGATIKNFLDAYQRKRTGPDSEATNVDEQSIRKKPASRGRCCIQSFEVNLDYRKVTSLRLSRVIPI